jgi:hypothetical protein
MIFAPALTARLGSALGGRSSAGRAPGCGPGGRGFESRRSPLRDRLQAAKIGCAQSATGSDSGSNLGSERGSSEGSVDPPQRSRLLGDETELFLSFHRRLTRIVQHLGQHVAGHRGRRLQLRVDGVPPPPARPRRQLEGVARNDGAARGVEARRQGALAHWLRGRGNRDAWHNESPREATRSQRVGSQPAPSSSRRQRVHAMAAALQFAAREAPFRPTDHRRPWSLMRACDPLHARGGPAWGVSRHGQSRDDACASGAARSGSPGRGWSVDSFAARPQRCPTRGP